MKRQDAWLIRITTAILLACCLFGSSTARVQFPVLRPYEDTVRIVLLTTDAEGSCSDFPDVGYQTRDFVVASLDTAFIRNVRIIDRELATTARIQNFWPGKQPHVIVHINAGWGDNNPNAPHNVLMNWAVQNYVGIVEIGDDAAAMATTTFGFANVDNQPAPMDDARWLDEPNDSLWLRLHPSRDPRTPNPIGLNGIILNAHQILGTSKFDFKPRGGTNVNNRRCQADADAYTVLPAYVNKVIFLGFQQGWSSVARTEEFGTRRYNLPVGPVGTVDQWNTVVAFQDTSYTSTGVIRSIRRGVALSYQPQFLQNTAASQQLVYDAIMYASLTHTLEPADSLKLSVSSGTLVAGEFVTIKAHVFAGNATPDPSLAKEVTWRIDPAVRQPGDSLTLLKGDSTRLTATLAYRTVRVIGTFIDPVFKTELLDTAYIYVVPAAPDNIQIVNDTIAKQPTPNQITFSQADSLRRYPTVVFDRFGNFISYGVNATWVSRNTLAATVSPGNQTIGEGIIARATTLNDSARIVVSYTPPLLERTLRDSVLVRLTSYVYDSLRIVDFRGRTIDTLTLSIDQSDSLLAQARQAHNGVWVLMPVTWRAPGLSTVNQPPDLNTMWKIQPTQPGTGFIKITRAGSVPDSVFARFLPGGPASLALYPRDTLPSAIPPYNDAQPLQMVAGSSILLVARIFDRNGTWLSQYGRLDSSLQVFSWSIERIQGRADIALDTLSTRRGYRTQFSSIRAGSTYRITVTFSGSGLPTLTRGITVVIVPDVASQLVIEADSANPHPNRAQHYEPILFSAAAKELPAYAILRDRFENFVGFSTMTEWKSLDPSVVTATESAIRANKGQGDIVRIAQTGITKIVAQSRSNSQLVDTATVRIENVSYTALRIVSAGDTLRLDSLRITSGRDTLLQVQGLREFDNTWVTLPTGYPTRWFVVSPTLPSQSGSGTLYQYAATTPGSGHIVVTAEGLIPDTIAVIVQRGGPAKLVLHPRDNLPPGPPDNQEYPSQLDAAAGSALPLVGLLFDRNNIWLSEYVLTPSLSNQITWTVVEGTGVRDSTGILNRSTGHKVTYTPIKAYRQVRIIAALGDFRDTITLNTRPGREYRLYIESSPDWQANPHAPAPIDTVKIADSTHTQSVFAIVRDSLGNFVRFSDTTSWTNLEPNIVTVVEGWAARGEGVISRDLAVKEGITRIIAVDKRGFRDTAFVQLLPYRYVALRIIPGPGTSLTTIDGLKTLTINTNQTATVLVEGLRSDTALWEPVPGTWRATQGLTFDREPPRDRSVWTFSPIDTGRGFISVTLGEVKPDSLRVVFTPGPPTGMTITILTPPDQRVAGSPITAVVHLYNQDGLVPGRVCLPAYYQDILGSGGRDSTPKVVFDDTTLALNRRPDSSSSATQCFDGGVDTVRFYLYYASADSLHRIYASVGAFKASTDPFRLFPGPLDTLLLMVDGRRMDTLVVRAGQTDRFVRAVGFDKYGNEIGMITSNWSVDGTLHDPIVRTNKGQIPYGAGSATTDEFGRLIAMASDDPSVSGRIFVRVLGPLAEITRAVTRDFDGNGYLDAIELTFGTPLEILDSTFARSLRAVYLSDTLKGTSVSPLDATGTRFLITLQEKETVAPQTVWTPFVTLVHRGTLGNAPDTLVAQTIDGAGPVVWSVTKYISDTNDRSKDRVVVVFSEAIRDSSGRQVQHRIKDIPPKSLFDVWRYDFGTRQFVLLPDVFANIRDITPINGSTVEFLMTNGFELTADHYLSIRVDTTTARPVAEITDSPRNYPVPGNKRVQVKVPSGVSGKMKVGPNPMWPTEQYSENVLTIWEAEEVRRRVKDHGGVGLYIPILIPSDTRDAKLTGSLQVYDLAGNLVYSRSNLVNMIPDHWLQSGGTVRYVVLYWNGITDKGRRSAPGVYRSTVRLRSSFNGEITDNLYHESVGVVPGPM